MPIIIDTDATSWATRDEARAHWADARSLDDAVLDVLLEIATEECKGYAPAVVPSPLPQRYMLATVYQAREVWSAVKREGDVIGVGDYAIRSRPLTGAVKQLLRPASYSLFVGTEATP